jgi:hypothetical protein
MNDTGPNDHDRARDTNTPRIAVGIALGLAVGAALSAALGSSAWIGVGIAVGAALGFVVDQAQRLGRDRDA